MRKLTSMITLTLMLTILLIGMTVPAMAAGNNVDGADPGTFGKPTSVDEITIINGPVTEADNINRSKDSAIIPPSFGSPSSNAPGTGELLTPNIAGISLNPGDYSVNTGGSTYVPTDSGGSYTIPDAVDSNNTLSPSTKFTLPDGLFYSDGSLGTLKIPALGLTVKVYEDESLESLAKGAGHFKSTSCWDGNIAIAGHNRGTANHFGQIHTLVKGDRITYTTKLGTRTYEVFYVDKISETNFSRLQRSEENLITLITCVRDVPTQRWCIQAREIT